MRKNTIIIDWKIDVSGLNFGTGRHFKLGKILWLVWEKNFCKKFLKDFDEKTRESEIEKNRFVILRTRGLKEFP